ncbi:hypothetical protein APV28_4840 [Comamonas testosteroni]|nr:hypothetical protein APV28_4840 [Comamonas testosteroni]
MVHAVSSARCRWGGAAGGGMKKPGESGRECPRMAPALSHRRLKPVHRHKKSAH